MCQVHMGNQCICSNQVYWSTYHGHRESKMIFHPCQQTGQFHNCNTWMMPTRPDTCPMCSANKLASPIPKQKSLASMASRKLTLHYSGYSLSYNFGIFRHLSGHPASSLASTPNMQCYPECWFHIQPHTLYKYSLQDLLSHYFEFVQPDRGCKILQSCRSLLRSQTVTPMSEMA
jgi:hypothetical protein